MYCNLPQFISVSIPVVSYSMHILQHLPEHLVIEQEACCAQAGLRHGTH